MRDLCEGKPTSALADSVFLIDSSGYPPQQKPTEYELLDASAWRYVRVTNVYATRLDVPLHARLVARSCVRIGAQFCADATMGVCNEQVLRDYARTRRDNPVLSLPFSQPQLHVLNAQALVQNVWWAHAMISHCLQSLAQHQPTRGALADQRPRTG